MTNAKDPVKVLVFARDPGAANHLVALIEVLRGGTSVSKDICQAVGGDYQNAHFEIYGRTHALSVWQRTNMAAKDWDETFGEAASAENVVSRTKPDIVLTGTSDIDEATDCALWRAAARAGIPSIAIVDHESSANFRFQDASGAIWPDHILVPNTKVSDAVRATGAPERSIIETGNLHIARTARRRDATSRDTIKDLRSDWGAQANDRVFLFASECSREMAALGRSAPYDEVALLAALTNELAEGEITGPLATNPAETLLVVRYHPRDDRKKYAGFTVQPPLRMTCSEAGSPEEAVLASDIVVGMQSSLLLEAAALGVPTHSLTGWDQLERIAV